MRNKILILFFFTFVFNEFNISAQEVDGEILYNVSFNTIEGNLKDNKALENADEKTKASLKHLFKNAKDVKAVLKFNKQESLYALDKKMRNDLVDGVNLTISRAGGTKKFYTSKGLLEVKNYEQECKILGECFLISNNAPVWELTQETKVIGGYLCYKAVNISSKNRKKKPVAWYAPTIPVSFGPKHYYGLPGIILELEESAVTFTAIKIQLNPKKKIKIKKPSKGKKVSRAEYKKILRKSFPEFYKKQ